MEDDEDTARKQQLASLILKFSQLKQQTEDTSKSTDYIQRGTTLGVKSEAAVQLGRGQPLFSEDKENIYARPHTNARDSSKNAEYKPGRVSTDSGSDRTGDLLLSSISCLTSGTNQTNGPLEDQHPAWRSGSQRHRANGMPGRVPTVPLPIQEMEGDNDYDEGGEKPVKRSGTFIPSSISRQTSGSTIITFPSAKRNSGDNDFLNLKPPTLSPEPHPGEEVDTVDSTTTLMTKRVDSSTTLINKRDSSKMEDTTQTLMQVLDTHSPEACRVYLLSLEKRGDPHTNPGLLAKLIDCYDRVFARLPLAKHSRNESYAKMYIRWAELKGIEDPDDARDYFIMARSNSKHFAFVHIAHAQFELSQGNPQKAASILQKAHGLNARPAELLNEAVRNLKAGSGRLLPPDHSGTPPAERDREAPARVPQAQPKPLDKKPLSEWKMPTRISRQATPEKQTSPPEIVPCMRDYLPTPSLPLSRLEPLRQVSPEDKSPPEPIPRLLDMCTPSLPLPSRFNPPAVCQTPNYGEQPANSYVTPVVKRKPPIVAPPSAPHRPGLADQPYTPLNPAYQPYTPVNPAHQPYTPINPIQQPLQGSIPITINGRQYFVLKKIGQGGSSKVYQVMDSKHQLFAVKCVNLEEADAQTVESYKNEIEHLNHLQQYSDQIIKLHSYEINNSHIYMLMELGNLDLSSWLRKRKTVYYLERKLYWKNMLEAVSTIHKHGIVHSDLKPANFVIVNDSLKLIDFGIANRIQPDVTSIMKNSQVGTLNYMPPETIKDTSSKSGGASSKISPKGDVWSLGCILYCMTYGKTPFQTINNQCAKLHAIIDPSHHIDFPDIPEKDLLDVLKRCLVRNPKERISIQQLLEHPYLQLQPQSSPEPPTAPGPENAELRRIMSDLAVLYSPNSLVRAVNNVGKMCNSGRKQDVSECVKPSSQSSWK